MSLNYGAKNCHVSNCLEQNSNGNNSNNGDDDNDDKDDNVDNDVDDNFSEIG